MKEFEQSQFEVRLEWGAAAINAMAGSVDCVIIIDVMSFSTCVSLAVEKGARIYPYPWKTASADAYAQRRGAQVASSRSRFTGEGYSLSPTSIQHIQEGEDLVLPSPNGSSLSFQARNTNATVFSGCFRNLSATAALTGSFNRILFVPCGERWPDGSLRPCLEDYIAAGGIIAATGRDACSPEAEAAVAAWHACQLRKLEPLYHCSSAVELQQRGFSQDVALCLATDAASLGCQLYNEFYASAQA
ncbi:2-phosphosulfolactate phosphatase [Pantoea sp.]|uniref:2-phosphosulfolactate phosphatase n=1 Tax=Pantoea sp. TaxID=69393 RepID=UPI0031CDE4D4